MSILKTAIEEMDVDPVTIPIRLTDDGGVVVPDVDMGDDALNAFDRPDNEYQTSLHYDRGESDRLHDISLVLEKLTGTLEALGIDESKRREAVLIQESIDTLIKSYDLRVSDVATEAWDVRGTASRFFNRANLKKVAIAIWRKFREYIAAFFKLVVGFLNGIGDLKRKSDGKAKKITSIIADMHKSGKEFKADVYRIRKTQSFKSMLPAMLNMSPGDYPVDELHRNFDDVSNLYFQSVVPALGTMIERLQSIFTNEYTYLINAGAEATTVRDVANLVTQVNDGAYAFVTLSMGLVSVPLSHGDIPADIWKKTKTSGDITSFSLIDVNSITQLPGRFNIFTFISDEARDSDMKVAMAPTSVIEMFEWKSPVKMKDATIYAQGGLESIVAFFEKVSSDLGELNKLDYGKVIKEIGLSIDNTIGLVEKHLLDKLSMATLAGKLGFEPEHIYKLIGTSFVGKREEFLALSEVKDIANNGFYKWASANAVVKKITDGDYRDVGGLTKTVRETFDSHFPDMVDFLKLVIADTNHFRELDTLVLESDVPLPENLDIMEAYANKILKDTLLGVKDMIETFHVGAVVNYEKLVNTAINYCGNVLTELDRISEE